MANGGENRSIVQNLQYFFKKRTFVNEQISRINLELKRNMSVEDTLSNRITLKLFYKYIEQLTGNYSKIMRVLRCYDLCDEFLCDIPPLMEYELDNIFYMCSEGWQKKLDLEIRNRKLPPTGRILTLLTDLRNESLIELEVSDEYNSFKRKLLDKSDMIKRFLRQIYNEI